MTHNQWCVTVTISGLPFLGEPQRLSSPAGLCLLSLARPKVEALFWSYSNKTHHWHLLQQARGSVTEVLCVKVQGQKTVAKIEDTCTKNGILFLNIDY